MSNKNKGWAILALFVLVAGCAPVVPPSFQSSEGVGVRGPVLAVASGGGRLAAATPDGLFLRAGGGSWTRIDAPGINNPARITALAMLGEELFVGTKGEGLHIFSGGAWEVRNSRYGGLADDRVLCVAVDPERKALPGIDVWVGTGKGLAVRREGRWEVFAPAGRWLWALTEAAVPRVGAVYLSPGFSLGDASERGMFRPPVTAIDLGQGRVVLGGSSEIAVLEKGLAASISLESGYEVTRILSEGATIWAGTSRGLLWGGFAGEKGQFPYPSWRPSISSGGILFGTRDARPYSFTWRLFGFNTAQVEGLARDSEKALWVAYRAEGPGSVEEAVTSFGKEAPLASSGLRRYGNIEDYLASGERPHYESYGPRQGIKGDVAGLVFDEVSSGILVGTGAGPVLLR